MDVVVKPSKVMSQILSFFYTHFKNPNIVYLSCLHLWTTRPPRLFLEMLPIIWVFLLSCLSNLWCILIFGQHTHTYTHRYISLHTFYSLSATILLHQKVLWHIEVIFLEISCFCKKLHLLVFSNSWELHFSKLQKSWKRSKTF